MPKAKNTSSATHAPVALVTGASGLIGSYLIPHLEETGYTVRTLSRNTPTKPNQFQWNPDHGKIAPNALEGVDVIFHLAGAGIADKRWTKNHMAYLLQNRAACAATLANAIQKSQNVPKSLIVASAVGFYGIQDHPVSENDTRGAGFAADICTAIEENLPQNLCPQVTYARLGVVLSKHGGALPKMKPAFTFGLGGRLGSGKQPFSWIHIEDTVNALLFLAQTPQASGPINLTAPTRDTNTTLTKALSSALKKPAIFPMPAPIARLLFGKMADELLLNGTHAQPKRLEQLNFLFKYKNLKDALKTLV